MHIPLNENAINLVDEYLQLSPRLATLVYSNNLHMASAFSTTQEMYNYAANQLIVQKLSQQDVKINLIRSGVTAEEADTVIQNMMVEIAKNK